MAVYRCPKCEQIVMKTAKRCPNCGLFFDLDHEPVLDEGNGGSTELSKKEKRKLTVFLVVAVIAIVLLFWLYFATQRTMWSISGLR